MIKKSVKKISESCKIRLRVSAFKFTVVDFNQMEWEQQVHFKAQNILIRRVAGEILNVNRYFFDWFLLFFYSHGEYKALI